MEWIEILCALVSPVQAPKSDKVTLSHLLLAQRLRQI